MSTICPTFGNLVVRLPLIVLAVSEEGAILLYIFVNHPSVYVKDPVVHKIFHVILGEYHRITNNAVTSPAAALHTPQPSDMLLSTLLSNFQNIVEFYCDGDRGTHFGAGHLNIRNFAKHEII